MVGGDTEVTTTDMVLLASAGVIVMAILIPKPGRTKKARQARAEYLLNQAVARRDAGLVEGSATTGWVVVRCNGFGAWYIVSRKVCPYESQAYCQIRDDRCEVLVPWQGTQDATLQYRSDHDLLPTGRLP